VNHIAFIIPTLDRIGGAERQVIMLANGLRQHGWRVSVVTLSGTGGDAATDLIAAGVSFLSLEMRKGLADSHGWFRFNRWLRSESPDILHAHLPHAAWLARWSRLAAPVRVVVDTLHSSSTGSIGRQLGYRFSDWLTDEVTAVSRAVADTHLAAFMASRIAVLPNGVCVETRRSDPALRAALRHELSVNQEFLWLTAGRLDPVKNYPTLLSAIAQLPQQARLVIAGSGPLQTELLALSTNLGLESRIRFLGFKQDVRKWMHAADAFVLSSRWEGLPMALLEAAACALPAVATDVPGTREVVVHGQTGWLAPAGDASALATAMIAMMEWPVEQRSAMGERARQYVVDHFGLDAVLDRWETLYRDLLQRSPAPRRRGHAR
jgi:glycosyltransferase involved in cell wall biosynthesis